MEYWIQLVHSKTLVPSIETACNDFDWDYLNNIVQQQQFAQCTVPYEDDYIQVPEHYNNPIRIYYPNNYDKNRNELYPIFYYIHGGGFVVNSYTVNWEFLDNIRNNLDIIVISIGYRKGPKHVFPTAVNDVYHSYLWLIQNAQQKFNGDSHKIIVGGESAGMHYACLYRI